MGAGAEGEVRPCAWKWEWKLKSRIENEEGGPRPTRSSSQQEREREAERGSAQGEWYLIEFFLVLFSVEIQETDRYQASRPVR